MAAGQRFVGTLRPPWRWFQCGGEKRGRGIGYSGHKHQRGEKVVNIADNAGHILSPLVVAAVNVHDSILLPDSVDRLAHLTQRLGIDLYGSFVTFDPGFDSAANKQRINAAGLIPVIKPNFRNTKDKNIIAERNELFAELKPLYRLRYRIERCYAWEDTYRKLVIRYERLPQTFLGWLYLASAMINFRACFGKNGGKR